MKRVVLGCQRGFWLRHGCVWPREMCEDECVGDEMRKSKGWSLHGAISLARVTSNA